MFFELATAFFLPPLFCQKKIPAFWTQNLGYNRQISAKIG